MWVYFLTGMVCCLMGIATEKYSNKYKDYQLEDIFKNNGKLYQELYDKNCELLECREVIRKLECEIIALETSRDLKDNETPYTIKDWCLLKNTQQKVIENLQESNEKLGDELKELKKQLDCKEELIKQLIYKSKE